jgi:hypothetical protein
MVAVFLVTPGAVSYEFFHQDRSSYVKTHPNYCVGTEGRPEIGYGSGNAWGHAHSPDMLHWTTEPVTGICASSGGGVTLPPDFRGPNGEKWQSAMLASGGGPGPMDTNGTGRGLKLWVSNDTVTYKMYMPPGTKCYPATLGYSSFCQACVICPSLIRPGPSNPPLAVHAAFIGDGYMWSEPEWNVPSTNRTYYQLTGTGTCQPGLTGGQMCGWTGSISGGAQALLFSSKNLVDWRFVSGA